MDWRLPFGEQTKSAEFYQYWAKLSQNKSIPDLSKYSFAIQLCENSRFTFPSNNPEDIENTFSYAYHFDATLYAGYLREISERAGVLRVNGVIESVKNNPDTGDITSLVLSNGQEFSGDLFIDCSGFRSLLLNKNLRAEFEEWSKWLLCDRAVAVQSTQPQELPPYTTSTAKEAGWQWRIPLQNRAGNGYVYSSNFINDDQAHDSLLKSMPGDKLTEPRLIKFKAGRYKRTWNKNCIAIGLSSGFLEPLESTSIYLIHIAIICLLRLFPARGGKSIAVLSEEYNRLIDNEYERIRDFLILHYYLNDRKDSELWRYCQTMQVPDSLTQRIDLFRQRGYIEGYKFGLFGTQSWLSVFHGQGLLQRGVNPFVSTVPLKQIDLMLEKTFGLINQGVEKSTAHEKFLKQYCSL